MWQLEPRQLALANPAWKPFAASLVESVRVDLGIAHDVRHDLYKLLVYEKGSFFAPHRDTEKQEGMFATLVVTHDGERQRIELGGGDARFQVRYAAFYADCQHEVLPVRRGYRICLVYNLSMARKRQPVAPRSCAAVATAARLLAALFEDPSREKVAIALKHHRLDSSPRTSPGRLRQAGSGPARSNARGSRRALRGSLPQRTEGRGREKGPLRSAGGRDGERRRLVRSPSEGNLAAG